jgi:hypothetical protein
MTEPSRFLDASVRRFGPRDARAGRGSEPCPCERATYMVRLPLDIPEDHMPTDMPLYPAIAMRGTCEVPSRVLSATGAA